MRPIFVTVRPPNRQSFTLVIDRRIELGRESDGVIVVDNRVSRRHVALEPGPDDRVIVTDLGSSNGTTLDGLPLDDPTPVGEGSVVVIGDTRIEIGAPRPTKASRAHTELAGAPRTAHSSIEVVADAVVEELDAHVLGVDDEPGTLTVVFSDIERSTELALALGDAVWFDVLQRHGRLVSAHVRAHRGRIVQAPGRRLHVVLPQRARSALLSAIGIERDLAQTAVVTAGARAEGADRHAHRRGPRRRRRRPLRKARRRRGADRRARRGRRDPRVVARTPDRRAAWRHHLSLDLGRSSFVASAVRKRSGRSTGPDTARLRPCLDTSAHAGSPVLLPGVVALAVLVAGCARRR